MFDHFVLTKFNTVVPWAKPTVHLGLDEGWLERRFDLFEKYCLPSMIRQTQQSVQWLVFFDERTPERFVKRIEELRAKCAILTPVYCKVANEKFVLEEMRSRSAPDRIRIMTNLDNDDALHSSMVREIQDVAECHFESSDLDCGFFISFPIGYSECKGDYYLQRFRYNPFVSFVSSPEYGRTIFGWDHTKIAGVAPVVYKYLRPMWCQIVHGENVANTVRGLYWPWGRYNKILGESTHGDRRSLIWKCSEFFRSFNKYILKYIFRR